MYDTECSNHLIYDKARFLDDIRLVWKWVKTFSDNMPIKEYETMLINVSLNERNKRPLFQNTIYILIIDVIWITSTKFIKVDFDRCSRINILTKMNSKKQICDIFIKHSLLILKYASIKEINEMQANFLQTRPKILIKTLS